MEKCAATQLEAPSYRMAAVRVGSGRVKYSGGSGGSCQAVQAVQAVQVVQAVQAVRVRRFRRFLMRP